jgi:hypothetical protein
VVAKEIDVFITPSMATRNHNRSTVVRGKRIDRADDASNERRMRARYVIETIVRVKSLGRFTGIGADRVIH